MRQPNTSAVSHQKQENRRTQDEGDGNLLGVSVTVERELLKQPLLVVRQDRPAEDRSVNQRKVQPATSTGGKSTPTPLSGHADLMGCRNLSVPGPGAKTPENFCSVFMHFID